MGKKKRLKVLRWENNKQQTKQSFKELLSSILPLPYLAGFFLLIFLVYWQTFFNGFVWDDLIQVVAAKDIVIIQNIPKFFMQGIDFSYRPLFYTTLSALNSLFGLQPFYFHIFSLILHSVNVCLVFILSQKFFASRKVATIIAILFAIHPINVESVAYIASFSELLYFQFGCIALLLFIIPRKLRTIHLVLACLFLLLSLFAKETGFLFLPLICLYFVLFKRKHLVTIIGSLITMFGVYLFLRLVIAQTPVDKIYTTASYIPMQQLSLAERLIHIPAIFQYYISTFLFPMTLQVQQYWLIKDLTSTSFYWPLLLFIFCFAALWILGRVIYNKDKAAFKTYLFFLGWFTCSLAFHFQLLPLSMTVADRWFYLSGVGLLGLLACITLIIPTHWRTHPLRWIGIIVLTIYIIGLAGRTIVRTHDWKNNYTLYTHDIKVSQPNFSLENDVAHELMKRGKFEEAKLHIDTSLKLAPDWWLNWANLGIYYQLTGQIDMADHAYKKAIENGKYVKAYELASRMHLYTADPGSTASAKKVAEDGLIYYPAATNLWEVLALAHYQLGDNEKAAHSAMQAYKVSGDERFRKLSEVISQGIRFSIKD